MADADSVGGRSLIDIAEVEELLVFVSRRGIDGTDALIQPLYEAVARFKGSTEAQARAAAGKDMFARYAELSAVTYKASSVNGRTLLDSKHTGHVTLRIMTVGGLFLVAALGTEIMDLWFHDLVVPEDGALRWSVDIHRYALSYLSPFFWGGLGACVYLIKRLSDEIGECRFDRRQFKGWFTRIALGAVLGAAVTYIYDPALLTDDEGGALRLDANVVAFLTGIGVKVVYGAIERTIATLSDKLNLAGVRQMNISSAAARGASAAANGGASPNPDGADPTQPGKEGRRGGSA